MMSRSVPLMHAEPGVAVSPFSSAPEWTSALSPSRVCGEEGVEVFGQHRRLVDRDQGVAVVDPDELGVGEVVGESLGVGGGHELVVSCPDDEDRAGEAALLVGPGEQLVGFGDGAEVLGEVAADLGVAAQRTDPGAEQVLGDPLFGQGAEELGGRCRPA